ncbi:MAG: Gfo/Idh/MocA family oxidoreductase [Verrucomicrobiota bacterium]
MSLPNLSRRTFLKSASVASAATVAFPHVMRSQGGVSPNSRLNIACVGVGGRGANAVEAVKGENLVAFCDVDEARAAKTFAAHPDVPRFQDYRQMFDKLGNSIDAVTVSTPDHMHFPIAMVAMALGKHVFVEKPMAHTVEEARILAKVAREKKLATQMGNQGHAAEGTRLLKEWYQAGVLGDIVEVHSWTNRPIWPQGVNAPDHSKLVPVVPKTLQWDLWLGVAAQRAYDPAYAPFNWRGYWDFGTGALGDMGCHQMDGGFYAFDLEAPKSVNAVSAKATAISAPAASVVTYEFAARANRPAMTWMWYDGSMRPSLGPWFEEGRHMPDNSTFIIGTKASVMADANYFTVRIVPETKMKELAPSLPAKTIPRIPGGDHFMEWVGACKGGTPAGANFDYASRLTEMVLLSNVAVRARRKIEWDSAAMKITNVESANQFLTKQYRPGFGV